MEQLLTTQRPERSAPPDESLAFDRRGHRPAHASAVRLDGLSKTYGKRLAVDNLSIDLPRGVTAGFLGPNGAGKTTTLAMLLGLVRPSSGTGYVFGEPLSQAGSYLSRVGALIETPAFYRGLSGRQNLEALAIASGRDRGSVPAILDRVGLGSRGDDAFRSYSLGMKQRLGIGAALLGEPELLILDEPTNGLDPAGTHEMRGLLGSLGHEERTILVSSHLLSEIEQVCDWLVIIDHGTLLFQGPASSFLDDRVSQIAVSAPCPEDLGRVRSVVAGAGYRTAFDRDTLLVTVAGATPHEVGAEVNQAASAIGVTLAEIRPVRPSLEDRYLSLFTGETND